MSGQEKQDDLQVSRDTENNKVLIIAAGEERDLLCSYSNKEILFQGDKPVSDVFNSVRNRDKAFKFFIYLGKEHNFSRENSVYELVDTMLRYNNVAATYTDLLVKEKEKEICIKHNPSYSIDLYRAKTMLNVPFICRSEIAPTFTQGINMLYLWDGLLDIMTRTIMFHIPKPLFELSQAMKRWDINADLKQIEHARY